MSGRTHEPGAALVLGRTVILAAAALLALGCRPGTAGDGTTAPPVPPGDWSGDLAVPGEPDAAFGVTWHLARTDAVPGLELSLSSPRSEGIGPVGLAVDGDAMRFPLPFDRSAACDLSRREDGSWRGSCGASEEGGAYDAVLVPPDSDLPVGAARMGLERVEGDWRATEAGRVVVHTRPGTEAHRNLYDVVRHAREALEHVVQLLDADGWQGPLHLVYLESPEEMERAVGRPVRGGWADGGGNSALLVTYDGGATGVVHEVLHVVSLRQWGAAAAPGGWLQEGLAEWGEGASCGEVPHGRLDRYLHRRGDGLSLSTLTEEFWEHSDVVTMPQATTLTGYLMDAHDMEAVRGLWDRGIDEAEAVLGYGIEELERRWRAWVQVRYEPASEAEFDATIGSDEGCPRVKP